MPAASAGRPTASSLVSVWSSRIGRSGAGKVDLVHVAQRQPGQEPDPDAAPVLVSGLEMVVAAAASFLARSVSASGSPTSWTASTSGSNAVIVAASPSSF